MENQRIINELFKRPVAYHPAIAKAFGSVKLAILWSQLYYWTDRTKDPDGWIYKTRNDIYEETGLSRKEQETARKLGTEMGILEEKLAGKPATMHFRINIEESCRAMEKILTGEVEKIKEIPESKIKTSSISYLRDLPQQDIIEIASKYHVSKECVIKRADDVIDYCEAKGKTYKDYKAALRNFVKMHIERYPNEVIKKSPFEYQNTVITRVERTPEQQKHVDEQLKKIRETLKNKFIMPV